MGKIFNRVSNVLILENGSTEGRFTKMLVEVDLTKTLIRGTKLWCNGQMCWITFKYSSYLLSASIVARLAMGKGLVGAKEKMLRRPMYLKDSMANGCGLQTCGVQLKAKGLGREKGFLYIGLIRV